MRSSARKEYIARGYVLATGNLIFIPGVLELHHSGILHPKSTPHVEGNVELLEEIVHVSTAYEHPRSFLVEHRS